MTITGSLSAHIAHTIIMKSNIRAILLWRTMQKCVSGRISWGFVRVDRCELLRSARPHRRQRRPVEVAQPVQNSMQSGSQCLVLLK
jgi:hypothetical protein